MKSIKRNLATIETFAFAWRAMIAALFSAVAAEAASSENGGIDAASFGRLPLVANGRRQPFDSLARNSLLQIREKQSIYLPEEKRELSAIEWALEVMLKPESGDQRKSFRIDHPEVISLLKLPQKDEAKGEDGKHYSWNQIEPGFKEVEEQRNKILKARKESSQQSTFEQALLRLHNSLVVYLRLKNTIHPQDTTDFAGEIAKFSGQLPAGKTVLQDLRSRVKPDEIESARNDPMMKAFGRYNATVQMETALVLPPEGDGNWTRSGQRLLDLRGGEPIPEALANYAAIADAFRRGDAGVFNQSVAKQLAFMEIRAPADAKKARLECLFNAIAPFYKALALYVIAFLLASAYWFNLTDLLRRAAFWTVAVAFVIHTSGLAARMWLEGRPPVTNLYSSAVFIGWGAVILGMVLERIWRNSIGLVVASALGFVTLIIAHHLSLGGDTMVMLQAVLDTNLWLATHVVIVTLGYASTFVSGFLAIIYIVRKAFTAGLDEATSKALARMVYGIVCFATLFSFVGTVLGGIWADQSWGRFWGWDPKENGALIIVLWNALILHARWGGMVREKGLMNLAVAGNIVTAWSWFGTNMLGVGLHSYGFMSGAFAWLAAFIGSQLALIGLSFLPSRRQTSPSASLPSAREPQMG